MSAAYREFLGDDDKRIGRSKSTKCASPRICRSSSSYGSILTVSFVRDYSARVEYSSVGCTSSDNSMFVRSLARSLIRLFPPVFGLQRVIRATQCTYRPGACPCVRARLGVSISKIATLANEVTLYNRDAPSMVLNEIG